MNLPSMVTVKPRILNKKIIIKIFVCIKLIKNCLKKDTICDITE